MYVKNGKGKKEGKCRIESNRQKQRYNKQSKYRNQNITDKLCNKAKTIEVKKDNKHQSKHITDKRRGRSACFHKPSKSISPNASLCLNSVHRNHSLYALAARRVGSTKRLIGTIDLFCLLQRTGQFFPRSIRK